MSEDPTMDGPNWYQYCGGNPVNGSDATGRYQATIQWAYHLGKNIGALATGLAMLIAMVPTGPGGPITVAAMMTAIMALLAVASAGFAFALGVGTNFSDAMKITSACGAFVGNILRSIAGLLGTFEGAQNQALPLRHVALAATLTCVMVTLGALIGAYEPT